MGTPLRRFVGYAESEGVPNIVVDGSPNRSTVLALTHWPGQPQPPGLGADLSAEMAFAYLDRPPDHPPATAVTNNHFDQDGLVAVFALVSPDEARRHRDLLVDVAAAGDFATYRHRAAARASMAIAAYADPGTSPIGDRLRPLDYPDQCRVLYEATVGLLVPMATDPDRFRDLWAAEDEALTASERAVATGEVAVTEHPEVDLAVVAIAPHLGQQRGHRFGHDVFDGVHPMALHNATACLRLLLVHGRRYRYVDRYETWVQLRSRRPRPRVDLRPLADRLTGLDDDGPWTAAGPSQLTPTLDSGDRSSLGADTVTRLVIDHLATAPPAWDPYRLAAPT
jgi:hypothetical protein